MHSPIQSGASGPSPWAVKARLPSGYGGRGPAAAQTAGQTPLSSPQLGPSARASNRCETRSARRCLRLTVLAVTRQAHPILLVRAILQQFACKLGARIVQCRGSAQLTASSWQPLVEPRSWDGPPAAEVGPSSVEGRNARGRLSSHGARGEGRGHCHLVPLHTLLFRQRPGTRQVGLRAWMGAHHIHTREACHKRSSRKSGSLRSRRCSHNPCTCRSALAALHFCLQAWALCSQHPNLKW